MEVGVEAVPLSGQTHGRRAGESFPHLTSPLNDQVNQTFTCTLRVTDKGSPPLSSLATLILYVVEDVPTTTTTTITTTPLALTQPFYLAEVWPGMHGFSLCLQLLLNTVYAVPPPAALTPSRPYLLGEPHSHTHVVGSPLTTFPAPVKVKGCNLMMSQVTYTLRNAWPGVTGEEVFVIDSVTGQVSLARGLDGSWVSGGNTLVVPLLIQAQDSIGRTTTAILQVTTRLQNTTNTHPQPSTLPAPPCRPASPTPCPCLASRSRRRGRLSFTRLSYAAEMFTTDVLVGRVEARLGGRRGSVRYSWASSTNVTTFVMNSISGVITVEPLGAAPGRHLLTARATAGRLTTTAQVSVRVLEDKKEGSGGDWARWDRTLGALRTCEPSDLVGLQVAVGVLAALLAAAVIAAAVSAMLLYRRRKASEARAQTEVKPISTLGSAYPNLSFSRETPE
ncbi:hypothetical protein GWK47_030750 [Chionoecetes opilio]|uniref:Uncharacterized protein n=1 Tax=Chionoecetes opilio TaxID=41210 RepID=A0A8J5D2E7_CHIOP|nr:hypothetical protein GWK47_030750 [Chionoecetes opilio]